MDNGFGLSKAIGPLLKIEREKAALTQTQLARRAGSTQQHVSKLEAGQFAPTTALVDRLFDALGLQLRVSVEARDADLDTDLDRADDAEGIGVMVESVRVLTKTLDPGVTVVVDGQLAAALQGVPIRIRRIELAFAESDLDLVATWLSSVPNILRWSEKWGDFAPVDPDPRQPGPLRYWTPWAGLTLRVMAGPPESIAVVTDDGQVRVRPLADVERDDPQISRLAERARARRREPTGAGG